MKRRRSLLGLHGYRNFFANSLLITGSNPHPFLIPVDNEGVVKEERQLGATNPGMKQLIMTPFLLVDWRHYGEVLFKKGTYYTRSDSLVDHSHRTSGCEQSSRNFWCS
jgi:hypothetical protein